MVDARGNIGSAYDHTGRGIAVIKKKVLVLGKSRVRPQLKVWEEGGIKVAGPGRRPGGKMNPVGGVGKSG